MSFVAAVTAASFDAISCLKPSPSLCCEAVTSFGDIQDPDCEGPLGLPDDVRIPSAG